MDKVQMLTTVTRPGKPGEAGSGKWIVIDAEGAVVGRLASFIAMRLRGKHRADFTPHADMGDHVIVINAEKVALTGRKLTRKVYYWHTGHPGGIKERTAGKILSGKHPERVIEKAVERMLPKESPLARKQFAKLRVYPGNAHPHEAQQPETVAFKSFNRKNSRIG
jgi:large subunit ribosomal protein L13